VCAELNEAAVSRQGTGRGRLSSIVGCDGSDHAHIAVHHSHKPFTAIYIDLCLHVHELHTRVPAQTRSLADDVTQHNFLRRDGLILRTRRSVKLIASSAETAANTQL
jgi:hypothetical protein